MHHRHKRLTLDYGTDGILDVLPRHLIHSILDRMSVRDAARTCILSRKWRYIWSEHPNLVFNSRFFDANFRGKPSSVISYVNAINNVLLLHKGPIVKFHLYIPPITYDWKQHTLQWLLYLSRNGIKELSLVNHSKSPSSKLPSYVFSCPDLEYLYVRNCIFTLPNPFLGFGKLSVLVLSHMVLDAEVFGSVVPCAPLLDKLAFIDCTGVEHFKIHTPKLTVYVSERSSGVGLINFKRFPNLAGLCIKLGKRATDTEQSGSINLIKLLDKLPKLHLMRCDGPFLELFAGCPNLWTPSTTFDRMRTLELLGVQFDNIDQMSCVECLLRTCRNLEVLIIKASDDSAVMPAEPSYLGKPPYTDQSYNNLRTVTISCIKGLRAELIFIERILASSPLLRTMFFDFNATMDASKKFEISTELMRFSRASPRAELVVYKK